MAARIKEWLHGQGLFLKTSGLGRTTRQIRDVVSLVLQTFYSGDDASSSPLEMTESDINDIICHFGFSAGGFTAKHNNGTQEGRSIRGTNGAATRRRNEAAMSAEDQAKLAKKRSAAATAGATAGAATRRRNEAAMSAEDQAKLVQERSDRARRNGTNDQGFFDAFYSLVEWLEDHDYKYPASSGKTVLERKLGIWIAGVRGGKITLDARRRRHLKAINFRWKGDKGWAGTVGKFPANWADQIED